MHRLNIYFAQWTCTQCTTPLFCVALKSEYYFYFLIVIFVVVIFLISIVIIFIVIVLCCLQVHKQHHLKHASLLRVWRRMAQLHAAALQGGRHCCH